jgi:hypothetical protein
MFVSPALSKPLALNECPQAFDTENAQVCRQKEREIEISARETALAE